MAHDTCWHVKTQTPSTVEFEKSSMVYGIALISLGAFLLLLSWVANMQRWAITWQEVASFGLMILGAAWTTARATVTVDAATRQISTSFDPARLAFPRCIPFGKLEGVRLILVRNVRSHRRAPLWSVCLEVRDERPVALVSENESEALHIGRLVASVVGAEFRDETAPRMQAIFAPRTPAPPPGPPTTDPRPTPMGAASTDPMEVTRTETETAIRYHLPVRETRHSAVNGWGAAGGVLLFGLALFGMGGAEIWNGPLNKQNIIFLLIVAAGVSPIVLLGLLFVKLQSEPSVTASEIVIEGDALNVRRWKGDDLSERRVPLPSILAIRPLAQNGCLKILTSVDATDAGFNLSAEEVYWLVSHLEEDLSSRGFSPSRPGRMM